MAKRKKVANGKGMNLVRFHDRCWVNEDYHGFYVELEGRGCNSWTAWVVNNETKEQVKFGGQKWYAMQQAQEYVLSEAGVPFITYIEYLEAKCEASHKRYLTSQRKASDPFYS